jgi:hypothetical protein
MISDPKLEDLVMSIVQSGQDAGALERLLPDGWSINPNGDNGQTMLECWKNSRISRDIEGLIPALEALEHNGNWTRKRHNGASKSATIGDVETRAVKMASSQETMHALGTLDGAEGHELQSSSDMQAAAATLADLGGCNVSLIAGPFDTSAYTEGLHPQFGHVDNLPETSDGFLSQQHALHPEVQAVQRCRCQASIPQALPSTTGKLLDIYFSFTHCYFPILARHDVLRLSYQYNQRSQNMTINSPGSGEIAALWSALAYADSYARESGIGEGSQNQSPNATGADLYATAKALIPQDGKNAEIGHIQALLILSLLNTRRSQWRAAWMFAGQAVRIATDLDPSHSYLQLPPRFFGAEFKSPARESPVFLGCFALDTLLSARLGRLPHLRTGDLAYIAPVEADGPDEWEPWTNPTNPDHSYTRGMLRAPSFGASTFNSFIELMKVLNNIICEPTWGSEWQTRCSIFQERLSEIMIKFSRLHPADSAQSHYPHHALFHVFQKSVLGVMRLRTQKFQVASSISPGLDSGDISALHELTISFRDCCEAFNATNMPPFLEFCVHHTLQELRILSPLSARSQTSAVVKCTYQLHQISLLGGGKAFMDLQEATQALILPDIGDADIPMSHDGQDPCITDINGENRAQADGVSSHQLLDQTIQLLDSSQNLLGRTSTRQKGSAISNTHQNSALSQSSGSNRNVEKIAGSQIVDLSINDPATNAPSGICHPPTDSSSGDEVFLSLAYQDTTDW